MFTDMVGYTSLGQHNESLSLALVDEQRKLIRPILTKHNGREVKTMGDAFLVEFPSAVDAARGAYDVQRAIREFNFSLSSEKRIHLRIGIHVGEVIESEGDISGDAVNIASRIEPLADDGGVCLSRQAYDHVQNKLDLAFSSLGPARLKNISEPIEVFKMVLPWGSESTAPETRLDPKRIVVLPFANISPDPVDAFFADGVTDEIISTISNIGGLSVISRTPAMGYKGTSKKTGEIGSELKVGSILEGSFRKAGNRIRVTVELVDVGRDNQVWAQSYDREVGDVFVVQADIAKQVADALKVRILPDERTRIERAPTQSPEAFSLYVRARHHWSKRSEEGVGTAIRYFQEAISKDPEYSLAQVGLADCYHISALFGYTSPKDVYPKAKDLVARALGIGGAEAEAHASMGELLLHYSYDWDGAEREFERSLQINPNYAIAHSWRSSKHAVLGQFQDALSEAKRGEELDPFAVVAINETAKNYYYARKFEEAISQFIYTLEVEPNSAYLHKGLADSYAQVSMHKEAVREIEKALAISNRAAFFLDSAACVYALLGEDHKAKEILEEAEKASRTIFVPSYGRAAAHAALGDKSTALQYLERAYNEHSWLIWVGVDPIFDPLRTEPGFDELLQRMNLKPH